MKYVLIIEGFEGQSLEVQTAGLFSGPKLFVAGKPANKGQKRGEMRLQRNDGKEIIAFWKPQFMGLDVPQLIVDGKVINVVEPLKWYAWVWSALPLPLIFIGGALGALMAMIGFTVSTSVFRSSQPAVAKFAISLIVSILAVFAYLFLASILLSALGQ